MSEPETTNTRRNRRFDPALKTKNAEAAPLREGFTFCVQGVISPLLANVYLHELDRFVEELKAGFDQSG